MYYIINQNEQIVAIDPQLLLQLQVEDADTFYKKVALNEITFHLSEDTVAISVNGETKDYSVLISPLAGMLGDIRLVDVGAPVMAAQEDEKEGETMIDFDGIDLFNEETPLEPEAEIELKETAASVEENGTEELFELTLPTDAENAIAEIESAEPRPAAEKKVSDTEQRPEDQSSPIYIDVERISETIGITPEDYNLFLNEYIDTALTFEKALQSHDEKEKNEALDTLSHLSSVLQLPFVGDILTQIKGASDTERDSAIESFFATLGRLTTAHFEEEKQAPAEEQAVQVEEEPVEQKRPPIDLSDVKPIHFDFQLEAAAEDLSLPVELIEEFVHDFIEQAHEETEKMLAAYEKGDLETVQKIGHLLKGTSSNLRITPLSDTLYEIQFNEDIDRVPELVRNYWAHFLSLENQFKLISNK
ncbi:MAG: Hpt domain-containing protein [Sulfurovum sp.]|nr:Hpt domain-containing protein [Sulfurovum sp.]